MAEARCWCGDFLLSQGVEAGVHFKTIHDLCWKADAAVRSAQELNDSDKRAELIRVLRAIQEEDRAAMDELCDYLEL